MAINDRRYSNAEVSDALAGIIERTGGVSTGRFDTKINDQMILAFPVVKDKIDVSDWSKKVYYAVQKAVYQLGIEARDAARARCPVDTGALKASIYVTSPASRPDQEDNKPYGRADAPGKASAGYRRAVEASGRKMQFQGEKVILAGEDTSSISENFGGGMFGAATLRPKGELMKMGMKRHIGGTSRTYKGNLGRSLGTRTFDIFKGVEEMPHLPFTPMAYSTKEQFWVTIGAAAYYAAFVEFGTSQGQKAQPFMGPAARDMERELPRRIKAALESVGAKKVKVTTL